MFLIIYILFTTLFLLLFYTNVLEFQLCYYKFVCFFTITAILQLLGRGITRATEFYSQRPLVFKKRQAIPHNDKLGMPYSELHRGRRLTC